MLASQLTFSQQYIQQLLRALFALAIELHITVALGLLRVFASSLSAGGLGEAYRFQFSPLFKQPTSSSLEFHISLHFYKSTYPSHICSSRIQLRQHNLPAMFSKSRHTSGKRLTVVLEGKKNSNTKEMPNGLKLLSRRVSGAEFAGSQFFVFSSIQFFWQMILTLQCQYNVEPYWESIFQ